MWYGMVWYVLQHMVWFGLWYAMDSMWNVMWYGMWCGMVWYDMVCGVVWFVVLECYVIMVWLWYGKLWWWWGQGWEEYQTRTGRGGASRLAGLA